MEITYCDVLKQILDFVAEEHLDSTFVEASLIQLFFSATRGRSDTGRTVKAERLINDSLKCRLFMKNKQINGGKITSEGQTL